MSSAVYNFIGEDTTASCGYGKVMQCMLGLTVTYVFEANLMSSLKPLDTSARRALQGIL